MCRKYDTIGKTSKVTPPTTFVSSGDRDLFKNFRTRSGSLDETELLGAYPIFTNSVTDSKIGGRVSSVQLLSRHLRRVDILGTPCVCKLEPLILTYLRTHTSTFYISSLQLTSSTSLIYNWHFTSQIYNWHATSDFYNRFPLLSDFYVRSTSELFLSSIKGRTRQHFLWIPCSIQQVVNT